MVPKKILVVEDESIIAMDIQNTLEGLGYLVPATASHGKEAMQKVAETHPDLILMDINLKNGDDGVEVAAEIRKLFNIPVVFLTAYSDEETMQRAKITEPYGYLLKPFEKRELHIIIEMGLYRHQVELALQKSHQDLEKRVADRTADLQKLKYQYELILNSAGEGICGLDKQGRATFLNPTATKMLGWSNDEFIGMPGHKLTHPNHPTHPPQTSDSLKNYSLYAALTDNSIHHRNEEVFWRKDGHPLVVEYTCTPMKEQNEIIGSVVVFKDIGERKKSEEEKMELMEKLQLAIKTRDEFISIASHELKTPLTTIKLQLQNLLRKIVQGKADDLGPEKLQNIFHLTITQLDKITRLVEDMLDITRLGANKLQLQKTDFDLAELIVEIVERYRPQLEAVKITVQFNIEKGVIGHWDQFRIDQVITNLISNTIKYAPGCPVEITLQKKGSQALLTIKDHGIGITPEAQTRIFKRFERAVSVSNISGLGLGLYISGQILELHGGTIRVESEVGNGSTFIAELPLNSPDTLVNGEKNESL